MIDYQDVEINGEVEVHGMRKSCQERWDIIKPYLKSHKTFLDIGSNLGYFTIKIAREVPNSVVASVEKNIDYAKKQLEIIKRNKLKNVILCHHDFSIEMAKFFSTYYEAVDVILMFSVLHYYSTIEAEEILKYVSRITPELIIEHPRPEEKSGGLSTVEALAPFEKTLKKYFQEVELIGEPGSYMSPDIKRDIFRARNPEFHRVADDGKHKISWNKKDGWRLDKKEREWIHGLNIHQFAMWNLIYPGLFWVTTQARIAYTKVRETNNMITDIHLRNLLFTSDGLQAIDYDDKDTWKLHGQSPESYCKGDWFKDRLKILEEQIKEWIH